MVLRLPARLKNLRKITKIGNWKRFFSLYGRGEYYWKNKVTKSVLEIYPDYFPNHIILEYNNKPIKIFTEKGDYRKQEVRWKVQTKALQYAINWMKKHPNK